jgi:hypothetical protein
MRVRVASKDGGNRWYDSWINGKCVWYASFYDLYLFNRPDIRRYLIWDADTIDKLNCKHNIRD